MREWGQWHNKTADIEILPPQRKARKTGRTGRAAPFSVIVFTPSLTQSAKPFAVFKYYAVCRQDSTKLHCVICQHRCALRRGSEFTGIHSCLTKEYQNQSSAKHSHPQLTFHPCLYSGNLCCLWDIPLMVGILL